FPGTEGGALSAESAERPEPLSGGCGGGRGGGVGGGVGGRAGEAEAVCRLGGLQ
ncbi:hypothetical protein HKBW3S34_01090, partial [Candidatus Hakubella thermalkaliphila]